MKEHIHIFDTTLRDGEQCPGAAMTVEQKIQVALQLEALGVDVIEAEFPVISDGDFHAVRTVEECAEKSREQIVEMAVRVVAMASGLCGNGLFSAEDAFWTEPEFLTEVVEAVIDADGSVKNEFRMSVFIACG